MKLWLKSFPMSDIGNQLRPGPDEVRIRIDPVPTSLSTPIAPPIRAATLAADKHDQTSVFASLIPPQLLAGEVLRRPLESTWHAGISKDCGVTASDQGEIHSVRAVQQSLVGAFESRCYAKPIYP